MKKILYLMHVDWNWIKQRPHFLAERLSENNHVIVTYKYSYNRKQLQKRSMKNTPKNLKLSKLWRLPSYGVLNFDKKLNILIMKLSVILKYRIYHPDVIYLTEPEQIQFLPKNCSCQIIYDCMDNHLEFCSIKEQKDRVYRNEKKLLHDARNIIVTSERLKKQLLDRYGYSFEGKFVLVRNGYDGHILQNDSQKRKENCIFKIYYIGTVASWFDADIIEKSLFEFSDIEYNIVGPVSGEASYIKHERVNYIGTVEHNRLQEVVEDADCLIMPFVLNELIEAVDPVKLYEYINFNKNIICVYYDEVKRFEEFVHFYKNYDEYKEILLKLKGNNKLKYTQEERIKFLKENSWEKRAKIINNLLR